MVTGRDEPVRRYFSHDIREGAPLPNGVRIAMRGRIKVGLWLPFTTEQTVDGRSFHVARRHRARAGDAAARRRPRRRRRGQLDFLHAKENVILLGRPGEG
jgi:hypothetical protein